jgi:hypothetical protein
MDQLLFPCVTFLRVFDTEPMAEALPLAELLAALRRFEVRADTAAAIAREVARIQRARDLVLTTGAADGPIGAELAKVRAAAQARGGDVASAVQTAADALIVHARKDAKRDLRIWAPALYRTDGRRGTDGVIALGCLVLDYDAGVSIDDAASTWEGWLHLIHTTWSHTDEHPRFRVVLPLARTVLAEDWAPVWSWASARADDAIDHALKSPGATFALPACASPDAPHFAVVNPGELLDPMSEGLTTRDGPVVAPVDGPVPSRMFRRDVKREIIEG